MNWTLYKFIAHNLKVKVTLEQAMKGQRGEQRHNSTLYSTLMLEGSRWSEPRHGRFIPRREILYPLYMGWWPQVQCVMARKISPSDRMSIPGQSSTQQVAIPTDLSGPTWLILNSKLFNTLRTGLLNCLNARSRGLTFRHRASCI